MEWIYQQISKTFTVLALAGLAFLSSNCSQTIKLKEIAKTPECQTTIEGFYAAPVRWDGPKPALIKKNGSRNRLVKGEIVSYDENGVTFDPEKGSLLFDPKPKYYRFKDISCAIDESGNVIGGKIPRKYVTLYDIEIHLAHVSKPETVKPYLLKLIPNEQFGYCIEPGTYKVENVIFVQSNGDKDIGVSFHPFSLEIEANKTNYVGNWSLNMDHRIAADSVYIPVKILERPGKSMLGGFLAGGVGTMLVDLGNKAQGFIAEHKLFFINVEDFQHAGRAEKVVSFPTVER